MPESLLHCPHPQPIETTSEVTIELQPLLAHLATNESSETQIAFPRGTLVPGGKLDMCKQNLGVAGCELVARALETDRHISSLLLGTNGIGDVGAAAIARLIDRNDRLEVVYLGCNAISGAGTTSLSTALTNNSTVTGLWLKRNPIGVDGAEKIAEMLRSNTTIQTLDLVNTQIGSAGLRAILEVLIDTNRTVKRLYLGGNDLNHDDAYLLTDLLIANPAIEALLLNVNHLGDRGVEILAPGLQANSNLCELGLSSNGISDRGCELLMQAIAKIPTLTRLELGYSRSTKVLGAMPNEICERGINAIANYLASNSSLNYLDLSRSVKLDRDRSLLATALKNNRTLIHLTIDGKLSPEINEILAHNRDRVDTKEPKLAERNRSIGSIRSVYR